MRDDILQKLYNNEKYLYYLRKHPKWYYFLDRDPGYFSEFERVVKKSLKLTTYDRLETLKNQVNFASALMRYFTNR